MPPLGCLRRFRFRARLGFSMLELPGQRGVTPAFGYGAPHPSARGTSTLLICALPGAHYGPIRHPHASAPLPGVAGYRSGLAPWISPRDVEGFSSCFTCPCHRAAVEHPAGVDSRISQIRQSMLPSPLLRKLDLRISSISGPHYVHLRCGPVTHSPLLPAALSMSFK